jgi:hypothetical protein
LFVVVDVIIVLCVVFTSGFLLPIARRFARRRAPSISLHQHRIKARRPRETARMSGVAAGSRIRVPSSRSLQTRRPRSTTLCYPLQRPPQVRSKPAINDDGCTSAPQRVHTENTRNKHHQNHKQQPPPSTLNDNRGPILSYPRGSTLDT